MWPKSLRHGGASPPTVCGVACAGVFAASPGIPRLAKLNGHLLPFGWAKALRARRKINAIRVIVLGVMPDYRHTGVAARLYQMHFDAAERTPQKGGEMGWTLEVNEPMNRALQGMVAEVKRRYRVYERAL